MPGVCSVLTLRSMCARCAAVIAVLCALDGQRWRFVWQVAAGTDLGPAAVARALAGLRGAGLVELRRAGSAASVAPYCFRLTAAGVVKAEQWQPSTLHVYGWSFP